MRALLLGGVLLSACATTKETAKPEPDPSRAEAPAAAAAVEPKPSPDAVAQQIEQMFARERESAGQASVTLDGKTIELEASGPSEVTRNDELRQWSLTFPIGTAEK